MKLSEPQTTITLRGPVYTFYCYGLDEAKQLGIVKAYKKTGTHAPVSKPFGHGEGMLLADWIKNTPDAVLVATGRYQITVYRPRKPVQKAKAHPKLNTLND